MPFHRPNMEYIWLQASKIAGGSAFITLKTSSGTWNPGCPLHGWSHRKPWSRNRLSPAKILKALRQGLRQLHQERHIIYRLMTVKAGGNIGVPTQIAQ